MRLTGSLFRRISFGVLLGLLMTASAPVGALQSTETSLLPVGPLLISGFRTDSSGTDIDVLEIYNNGKQLERLSDWQIYDTTNSRQLMFAPNVDGYIEPGSHALLATPGVVSGGASYQIVGWNQTLEGVQVIDSLALISPDYRPTEVSITGKTVIAGMFMSRNQTSTGYSTAAAPFAYNRDQAFDDGVYLPPAAPTLSVVEVYPNANACSPFDDSILCTDYIKLKNYGSQPVDLNDLVLRATTGSTARSKSNTFTLSGSVDPGEYLTVFSNDDGSKLAIANNSGYIWLEDSYGLVFYEKTLVKYPGVDSNHVGLSLIWDQSNGWRLTATPSPFGDNKFSALGQQNLLAPCPDGKFRNPATNRCKNIESTTSVLTPCKLGQERNPETNRCRSVALASASKLTPCKQGQVRNPATNRCKSIESLAGKDLVPCKSGQIRNPETNRCKKAPVQDIQGAKFAVEPTLDRSSIGVGYYIVAATMMVGMLYAGWEWRHELAALGRRVIRRR